MPKTTEQVEGGGSKVPESGWPSVLYVTEISPGSLPPSFRASAEDTWLPELPKHTYIPVSALLSDEVVEAFARATWPGSQVKVEWDDLDADDQHAEMSMVRDGLQAAVLEAS